MIPNFLNIDNRYEKYNYIYTIGCIIFILLLTLMFYKYLFSKKKKI